jgi:hypothetical protein
MHMMQKRKPPKIHKQEANESKPSEMFGTSNTKKKPTNRSPIQERSNIICFRNHPKRRG